MKFAFTNVKRQNCKVAASTFILLTLAIWINCSKDSPTSPKQPEPPKPPPTPVATRVEITPASGTLNSIGQSFQMTARVFDQNNAVMTVATVNWSSSLPAVATVSTQGLVTAVMNGTVQITARSGNASASIPVTVMQSAGSVVIEPSSATLMALGETVQLAASVLDGNGHPVADASVAWSSSDASVVTVSGQGLMTSVGSGTVQITAQSGSVSTSIEVNCESCGSDLVTIPDANLRAAIEETLAKPSGATITEAEMYSLTELSLQARDIEDLTGLEFALNLTSLDTQFNFGITDLSPLAVLTKLENFSLGCNRFTDLSPLGNLTNLTNLDVGGNGFADISALAPLTNLTELNLGVNGIKNISPLAGMTNLRELGLWGNVVEDISVLAGLTNLIRLELGGNEIKDISALAGLNRLWYLDLRDNRLTDISPLALSSLGDPNLILWLGSNDIEDISPLANLKSLFELYIEENRIKDISPLAGLTNLRTLVIGSNEIRDVSSLSSMTGLESIDVSFNKISVVSAMTSLTRLNLLDLKFNELKDISELEGLTNLVLDLRGNPLNESSAFAIEYLESNDVRVLFDSFLEADFDIELVFLDDVPESQKGLFRDAANRWMSVIVEDLPDFTFSENFTGTCGGQSFEILAGERIDDLRIYVTTDLEAKTALGSGGPRVVRETTHLTAVGCIQVLLDSGIVWHVALHEMGHVFGFGTYLWREAGLIKDLSRTYDSSFDTHFRGPRAIDAFDEAGGRDYPGKKVPFERRIGAHWRLDVLFGEIMIPSRWGEGALSAITVQALADWGYGVDVTHADAYFVYGRASKDVSARVVSEPELTCGVGDEQETIYVVDELGHIIRTIGE